MSHNSHAGHSAAGSFSHEKVCSCHCRCQPQFTLPIDMQAQVFAKAVAEAMRAVIDDAVQRVRSNGEVGA